MGDDATVKFGYDGTALDAGINAQERRMVQSAGRMEKSLRNVGGGGSLRSMGNVSMQIQDIAVQLQSGTKASIIFAQQGSQLLSAFGTAGAVAGGVAAVGAAFYTMQESATASFKAAIKGSQEFRKDSSLLIQSTHAENLATNLNLVSKQMTALSEERKRMDTHMGVMAVYMAGDKPDARRGAIDEEKAKAAEIYGRMVDRTLVTSKQELDISALRLKGQDAEADALERKYQLQQKIAALAALPIQDWAKQKLIQDATARAANAEALITGAAAKQERERGWQIKDAMQAKRRSIEYAKEELEIATLETDGRKEDAKRKKLDLFEKQKFQENMGMGMSPGDALGAANQARVNQAKELLQTEKKLADQKKLELQRSKETRDGERKSVEMLEAESKGQDRKLKKLQDEEYARRRMKELIAEGFGPTEAESITARELKAKKNKEKYDETGRAHIGGVTKKTMMRSGIDQFNRNQEKEYETTDPARPGYQRGRPRPMYDAFDRGSGPTSAQRNGRYMGGFTGTSRTFNQSETFSKAREKNDAASSGGGVASKIDKSNDHLSTIAERLA